MINPFASGNPDRWAPHRLRARKAHVTDRIPSLSTSVPGEPTAVQAQSRRERRQMDAELVAQAPRITTDEPATAVMPTPASLATGPKTKPHAVVSSPRASVRSTQVRKSGPVRSIVAMGFAAALVATTALPALTSFFPTDDASAVLAQASLDASDDAEHQTVDAAGDVLSVVDSQEPYKSFSRDQVISTSRLRVANTFTNNPNGTIQWPFMLGVRLSDAFGPRAALCNSGGCTGSFHEGQDFDAGDGAPIQAIADGTVITSTDGGHGVEIEIEHLINGQKVVSKYLHMRYGSRKVQVGDKVKVGQLIALVGNTGMSFGAHLHLEIRVNGVLVDPLKWLRTNAN